MRNKSLRLEESMSFDPSPEDSIPELQAAEER